MRFYIKDSGRTYDLMLRFWHGGWECGFGTDEFEDLEETWQHVYSERRGAYVDYETELDFSEFIVFWQSECDDSNHGTDGHVLMGLTDEQIEAGCFWSFAVKEVTE